MTHRVPPPDADRDVYESLPDAAFGQGPGVGSSTDHGHLGPAGRSVRSHEDIDDEPQEVNTSYEFFKGKEFGDEPSQGETRRGDYGPGKKTDYSRMDSTAPGSGSGKFSTFETPVQRLTRLQGEVEEMQEVVQVFLNSHATGEGDKAHRNAILREAKRYFEADPSKVFNELQNLQRQLQDVLADGRLQNLFTASEPTGGRRSQYDVVVRHLDDVTSVLRSTDASTGSEIVKAEKKPPMEGQRAPDDNTFSYELYCLPSMKPQIESSRLTALEKRLSDLENHIGVGMRRPGTTPFADLSSGLNEIALRLVELDSTRLDVLSQRMMKFNNELDALQRRRERLTGSPSSVEDQHVQQLYEMSDRWRCTSAALPLVIRRLRALKALHQESASVATRLNGECDGVLISVRVNLP
eukprot:GHVN01006232.1.p1 GENE.GHVN01006232.1~~GHVN01006232.1.p1  ORF type:complete len:409 (-),score=60.85 GHVN01006232.1:266-1492(-)